MVYANENILASILSTDLKKIEQVEKIGEISEWLTSDDGIHCEMEVMEKNIIRYTLTGTRCGLRFCWSVPEQKIVRQPRGLKRCQIFKPASFHVFAWDVAKKARERMAV